MNNLTPEQLKQLEKFREEWFEIGSCTDPAERPRAEKNIRQLYERLNISCPPFYWVDSPAEACVLITLLHYADGDQVERSQTKDWFKPYIDRVLPLLGNKVSKEVAYGLKYQYHATYLWGQQESYWVAFYEFPEKYLNVKYKTDESEQLHLWSEIAKSCGWWWAYDKACIVCERPKEIHWEEEREKRYRLHNAKGPAVLFRDGWKVYAYHGILVEGRIIEHPENITVQDIEQEQNAEIRRIKMEQMGLENYIQKANPTKINEDEYGILWRKEIPNDEPLVMVQVFNQSIELDGTRKIYFLRVPPEMKTAKEAVAWTWDISEERFEPGIRS